MRQMASLFRRRGWLVQQLYQKRSVLSRFPPSYSINRCFATEAHSSIKSEPISAFISHQITDDTPPSTSSPKVIKQYRPNQERKLEKSDTNEVKLAYSWAHMDLRPELMEFLKSFEEFHTPTPIQRLAIPRILNGDGVIIADQTGTGKTLAYLLPLIHNLTKWMDRDDFVLRPGAPPALILCPSRELAEQVLSVVKSISHLCRLRSCALVSGRKFKCQRERLAQGVDLVVATPGALLKHTVHGSVKMNKLRWVVIDEADTMYDRNSVEKVRQILAKKYCADPLRDGPQYILASATINQPSLRFLQKEFPLAYTLMPSTHHKQISKIETDFLILSGRDKHQTLVDTMEDHRDKAKDGKLEPTMIFANSIKSARAAENMLLQNCFEVVSMHKGMTGVERRASWSAWKTGAASLLVTTDLASRGLDSDCSHVVMLDFPTNATDYLHRAGRTGRCGRTGRVTALLQKAEVQFATAIEACHKRNSSIEGLHSDCKDAQMMARLVAKGDLDHCVAFPPMPSDKLNGSRRKPPPHFLQRLDFKKKHGVTNAASGAKYWYPVGGGTRKVRHRSNASERTLRADQRRMEITNRKQSRWRAKAEQKVRRNAQNKLARIAEGSMKRVEAAESEE